MSEGKTTRLSKAAREFNVGISTIVDFLHGKGVNIDANPNTKISEEEYNLLVKEYSSDGIAKKESEQVHLRGSREKKPETVTLKDIDEKAPVETEEESQEDEVIIKQTSFRDEVKNKFKEDHKIKVVGKIDLNSLIKKKPEPAKIEIPEEPIEEKPVDQIKEPEIIEEEPEIIESDTYRDLKKKKDDPDYDVKVVGRIDLSVMNQKTRPARKSKEEKDKERKERHASRRPAEREESAKVEKPEIPVKNKSLSPDDPENFIKARYEKLKGPTVIGKIAPVKVLADDDEDDLDKKKKRKRIKKEKEKVVIDDDAESKTDKSKLKSKVVKKKTKTFRPIVNEEDVDRQIKDTLARLTNRTKSKGAKYRREKRDAVSQRMQEEEQRKEDAKNIIKVTEFVSVAELSSMMNVPANEIISTCMNLGLFVSINQRLDAETMALVADEFDFKVEFVSVELQESIRTEEDKPQDLLPRPPIVTVMGHVDHGKTKLLDHIRNANVIAGEAGGITQHIGAYGVELESGKRITFLDTPGHEAFTAMRARGAQITDIVIIVVAADDGVMPQTVEAINHAHAAGVPIIFAINKIDKPTANVEKIKEELANMNFMVEDWGGKYQSQEISAKTGLNITDLLDKVLLEAEMLDLKANPNKKALGTVIESSLDKGRGYVATILIESGTLRIGDVLLAGSHFGHIKAMFNERGHKVEAATPATPVIILGLSGAPQAGDKFNVMDSDREAKEIANKREQLQREQGLRTQKHITLDEIGRRIAIGNFQELNIIVKGDVDGSVEALSDSLIKLSNAEIQVNMIHKGVGQISESDIMLAAASDAIVIGFQVRPSLAARRLAEKEEIDIRIYSIIYDAINELKSAMEGMLSPEIKEEIIATAEVREVFKITKVGTIAGCLVKEGKLNRTAKVRVIRDGIVVYTGVLGSLKRFKDDAKEVVSGQDCGLNIDNYNDIKVGDIIEAFQHTESKRKL